MAKTSKLTFVGSLDQHTNPSIQPAIALWVDKEKDRSFRGNRITLEKAELTWKGTVDFFDTVELHGLSFIVRVRGTPPAKWKFSVKNGSKAIWSSSGVCQGTESELRIGI